MTKTNERTPGKTQIVVASIIVISICAVIAFWGYPRWGLINRELLSDWGLFGDSFGPITSVFSGLSFAAVAYAILFQVQELKLQRLDLQAQRESINLQIQEMQETKAELKEQTKHLEATSRAAAVRNYQSREPMFYPSGSGENARKLSLQFKNAGATVVEVTVERYSDEILPIDGKLQAMGTNAKDNFGFDYEYDVVAAGLTSLAQQEGVSPLFNIIIRYRAGTESRCQIFRLADKGKDWSFIEGGASKDYPPFPYPERP